MAAPTLVSSIVHSGNPTTSVVLTFGATAADDILVAAFTSGGSDADPTIAGTTVTTGGLTWTKLTSVNGAALTDMNGSIWWTRATGNHTGQTVTAATSNSGSGVGVVVRGCDTVGTPLTVIASALNASGTNSLVGGTPAFNEAYLMLFLLTDDNIASASYTATGSPASYTERQDAASSGGNDTQAAFADATQATAADTGTLSWTNARGAGLYQVAILVAAKPPATDAPATHAAATGVAHDVTAAVAPGSQAAAVTMATADAATGVKTSAGVAAPTPEPANAQVHVQVQAGVASATGTANVPVIPAFTTPIEVALGDATDPTIDTGHSITVRARVTSAGTLYLELRQGTTVIESWSETPTTSFADYVHDLDAANVANITDYTDLRLRWYGSGASGTIFDVSTITLYVPADPNTRVFPSAAEGTGTGNNVTAKASPTAGAISLTVGAFAPSITILVSAGVASGTGTSGDADAAQSVADLIDNFDDDTIDATKWATFGGVTESGGRVQLKADWSASGIYTPGRRGMTGASCTLQVFPITGLAGDTTIFYVSPSGASSQWLKVEDVDGSSPMISAYIGGSTSTPIAYNPSNHRWWRCREDAGTMYFETSANGINSWSTLHSGTFPGTPAAVYIEVDAQNVNRDPNDPSRYAEIDNVNTVPASVLAGCASGTGTANNGIRVTYLVPTRDHVSTGWATQSGGTTNLYDVLDELNTDNSDYVTATVV